MSFFVSGRKPTPFFVSLSVSFFSIFNIINDRVPEVMEMLDKDEGHEEPDFLGLEAEKQSLMEIIEQNKSSEKNYFL